MAEGEPSVRIAVAADAPRIARIVEQAYRHYIQRIGQPPGPMLDDYRAYVRENAVWVVEQAGAVCGILVLLPGPGYLLLDNIAVAPGASGQGPRKAAPRFCRGRAGAAAAKSASTRTR